MCASRKYSVFFSVLLMVGLIFPVGCGKKAPPVSPQSKPVAAVSNLSAAVKGDRVRLTWSIPLIDSRQTDYAMGFTVYRTRKRPAESNCKNCPVLFSRVADIPMEMKNSGAAMTYMENLDPGYLYTYKVVSYTHGGLTSRDSNIVDVRY